MTTKKDMEIARLNKEVSSLIAYVEFLEQNKPVEEVQWLDVIALLSSTAVKTGRSVGMADGFICEEEDID